MSKKLSKEFKWIISIIGSTVGLFIFLLLVGFIVDCCTYPVLKKAGDEAQKTLMSSVKDEPGNGWDYYSSAIEKSKNIKSDWIWYKYLDGETEITPEIEKVIKENKDAIDKVKEGSKQGFCSIPYDYSKGKAVKIPDFMSLRRITEITCMKSLMELEGAENEKALDDILSVAAVGKHIANSSPNLLNQMIGFVFLNQAMKVLKIGLSADAFSEHELRIISESLRRTEMTFPMLASGLDGEKEQWQISLANRSLYKSVGDFAQLFFYENKIPSIFERIVFRFYCWRYLFSPRLASLRSFDYIDYIVSQMQIIENNYTQKCKKSENNTRMKEELYENAKDYAAKNPVFSAVFPNFIVLYNRKCEAHTRLRILCLACKIQSYYLKKHQFPVDLNEIGGDIITDFNTGKMWDYTTSGDFKSLFSLGPNQKSTLDDISITLKTIGLKEYLWRKRKGISDE